ncbi:hypothetical protein E3N88_42720 [Mikania micrantha]|uniref:NADP-dependent oxidoreductase domain-containing protein n=1 Tax=Mikania micrantha TaxID=192012 RepID=A0A5N6LHU2_9ASTR|nr:hypothetical protein E3N88_42720 [Mikania micrantha]
MYTETDNRPETPKTNEILLGKALKGGVRWLPNLGSNTMVRGGVKGDPAYVRAALRCAWFQPENLLYNKILYKRVNEIASKTRCTPSQLSLAWLHHQGNDVIPIPGTTKIENLEQNTGVLSVKLTPEEMTELECIASAGSVKGDRYGAGISTYLDSETPMLSSWQAMLRAV